MTTEATTPTQAGAHDVEQAEAARLRKEGKTDGGGGKQNAHQQRVDDHHAEIVGPSPAAPNGLLPPRHDEFPKRHDAEHAGKRREADIGLIRKHGVAHWFGCSGLLDWQQGPAIIQLFS